MNEVNKTPLYYAWALEGKNSHLIIVDLISKNAQWMKKTECFGHFPVTNQSFCNLCKRFYNSCSMNEENKTPLYCAWDQWKLKKNGKTDNPLTEYEKYSIKISPGRVQFAF